MRKSVAGKKGKGRRLNEYPKGSIETKECNGVESVGERAESGRGSRNVE